MPRTRKDIEKVCIGCGNVFFTNVHRIKYCSLNCSKSGKNSPVWKGDEVGIDALHAYIRKVFPNPGKCQICNYAPAYDLANISNEYKRDVSDWEWLCRKCHMAKDGRLNKLVERNKLRKVAEKICIFCGKPFAPKRAGRMFCTQSCATKEQHRSGRYKPRSKKIL